MKHIIQDFENLPTTCISDVLGGLTNMSPEIKPVRKDLKLVGRAYTVKVNIPDNRFLLKAMKESPEESVLVIDANGNRENAICGDFIVGVSKLMGIKGLIVDGVVRDLSEIRGMNYPVFCKGNTQAASLKHGSGKINTPISCGGVNVETGDLVVADLDGVVVVPEQRIGEVSQKAKEKVQKDMERESKFLQSKETALSYIEEQIHTLY
ncbi:RraA family protein [Alkalibacillus aidingensis]|uniref:RraA family protein n=1 Tax=Alkalibacillus aidingensis TaxID=2747607 RepID=UPI001660A15A|nr:RraA family protein [Alkalibacillus aidingensis]